MPGEESEIEIRPFYELEDFGEAVTPEVPAHEENCARKSNGSNVSSLLAGRAMAPRRAARRSSSRPSVLPA